MLKKLILGCAALALGSAALAGPALAQGAKVGALIPLTGGLQSYGEGSLNGIRLAIKEVNEAGGVLDGELELVVGDTQTKSQPAIDAAQKLVSVDNVVGLLGALSSGNTIPVATSVARVEGVPQISNASTAPAITTLDDDDFLFRTAPSDAGQGQVLADLVSDQGLSRVAVIYVNNDYGQGLNDAFTEGFEAIGGEVTGSAAYEPNKASYRGELSDLASADPEALVMIAYPDDGGLLILRQSLEEGFFDRFVFTDGMKTTQLLEDLSQYMEGMWGTAPRAVESEAYELFAANYEAEYGELPPLPFIDSAYDAAMAMALAIEKAGSTDRTAVRDALRDVANPPGEVIRPGAFAKAKELIAAGSDINYEGASGSVDFDDNGDVPGTYEHWAIEEQEIVTVEVIQN